MNVPPCLPFLGLTQVKVPVMVWEVVSSRPVGGVWLPSGQARRAFPFLVRFPFRVQRVAPPAVIMPVNFFALIEVRSALRARVSLPPLVVSLPLQCPVSSEGGGGSHIRMAHLPSSHIQCAHLSNPSSHTMQILGSNNAWQSDAVVQAPLLAATRAPARDRNPTATATVVSRSKAKTSPIRRRGGPTYERCGAGIVPSIGLHVRMT